MRAELCHHWREMRCTEPALKDALTNPPTASPSSVSADLVITETKGNPHSTVTRANAPSEAIALTVPWR